MILTYTFESFVADISTGRKKHTLRRDPAKRWKAGRSIQHWFGSPRNTRGKRKPYKFADGQCYSVQEVYIQRMPQLRGIESGLIIRVDGVQLDEPTVFQLIENDGLRPSQFREFFVPQDSPIWEGRIIHFTLFEYETGETGI